MRSWPLYAVHVEALCRWIWSCLRAGVGGGTCEVADSSNVCIREGGVAGRSESDAIDFVSISNSQGWHCLRAIRGQVNDNCSTRSRGEGRTNKGRL